MNRLAFLKRSALPLAAVAAAAAAQIDPDGEPVPEGAPLIVVNAPNTHLSNLTLTSGAPRRSAIEFTKKATGAHVIGGRIQTNGPIRG